MPADPRPARRRAGCRVGVLLLVVAAALLPARRPAGAAGFGLADIEQRARELAERPYLDPQGQVPRWLLGITYDQWRDVRFQADHALWRQPRLPFSVQFFHPGLFYDRAVQVNVVESGVVAPVKFSPDQFAYGANEFASRVPHDLGYAGLRIHYPIKSVAYQDEVIVFLGASYFRAVGRDQGFGISARGLALDTALPSGEEFPWFREFWLVRPAPGARELIVYALLDSESLTGAYRFSVRPGEQTRVDVELRLFRRRPPQKLGIAPLTSMFLRGEGTLNGATDYRPEVHDSDGLLIETGSGEWIWRPLAARRSLTVTSFGAVDPRGFGLSQRDRSFDHYQDLEARPDLRPSVWIAPKGPWGEGRVELVEIPTRNDNNDNVVAYWVPAQLPPPGEPIAYAYSMSWYGDDRTRPAGARATATRRDEGTFDDADRFVIDFEGGVLHSLPEGTVLRAVVTADGSEDRAEILEQQVIRNPATGGWRLVFQVSHPGDAPLELRAFLAHDEETLSETWSYLLRP